MTPHSSDWETVARRIWRALGPELTDDVPTLEAARDACLRIDSGAPEPGDLELRGVVIEHLDSHEATMIKATELIRRYDLTS